jgi:23S rRNA (uracil1939-C5)-methyltransferase
VDEIITLHLTAMAHGGAAVGRYEGRAVFVPYALPGETVRAAVVEEHERHAFARLLEVVAPAPERVGPPCPYFGPGTDGREACGGCHWQHAAYGAQLVYKAQVVADQLARLGGVADPPVRATLADPSGWAYRNHAQFHPAPGGGLGFQSAAGQGVVEIEACPLLHPLLAELYEALDLELEGLVRLSLRAGTRTGERMLIFEMADDLPPALEVDVPLSCVLLLSDGQAVNLIGSNHFTERVGGHTYRISAPSFFQINTTQAEELVRLVMGYLDLHGGETVLDAYCGVGLFSVPIAQRAGLVVGIELSPSAVEDLLVNAEGLDNIEVVEGPVEAVLPELDTPLDAAVLDPPRAGVERRALDALAARHPARIVYVSCDPATLARDAKRLIASGYRLVEVQPVDMFPQTYHVESVALFEA